MTPRTRTSVTRRMPRNTVTAHGIATTQGSHDQTGRSKRGFRWWAKRAALAALPLAFSAFMSVAFGWIPNPLAASKPTFNTSKPFSAQTSYLTKQSQPFALAQPLPTGRDQTRLLAGNYESSDDLRRFANAHDGGFVGFADFDLDLTENSPFTLLVLDISMVDVARSGPARSSAMRLYTQGSGPDTPVQTNLDLDHPGAALTNSGSGTPVFSDHRIRLAPNNPWEFHITAVARTTFTRWFFKIAYQDPAGKKRYVFVDAEGHVATKLNSLHASDRFAVTAKASGYQYQYDQTAAGTFQETSGGK